MEYLAERGSKTSSLYNRIGHFFRAHRRGTFGLMLIAIVGLFLYVQVFFPRPTTLTMIDVGQGDALVLRTRHGQTIVIDAGNDPGYIERLGKIMGPWDRTIDLLILSHPHEDHVSGFVDLIGRWKVNHVLWTGLEYPAPAFAAFQSWVAQLDSDQKTIAKAGQHIVIDGGSLDVLWPLESLNGVRAASDGAEGSGGVNDTSIVIEGRVDGRSFMLTGDVSAVVERVIATRQTLEAVDILKVGHHGSRYSTSDEWVQSLHPSIALISVGAKNEFNHPAQSVISRLREAGAQVYQTPLDGTISVEFRSDGLFVKTHQ